MGIVRAARRGGDQTSTSLEVQSPSLLVETVWPRWEFFVVELRPDPAIWGPPTSYEETICLK